MVFNFRILRWNKTPARVSYFTITWELGRLGCLNRFQHIPTHAGIVLLLVNWSLLSISWSCSSKEHLNDTSQPIVGLSKTSQTSNTIFYWWGRERREDNFLSLSWYFSFITRIKELWEMYKVNADKWFFFYLTSILIKTFCHVC